MVKLVLPGTVGVPETVCITDEGGFPLVLERMDGARVTGPQIAWNKAFTAAGHKRSTHLFNTAPNGPALPGNEAFGIQWSFEGKFAVFVGGFPITAQQEGRWRKVGDTREPDRWMAWGESDKRNGTARNVRGTET